MTEAERAQQNRAFEEAAGIVKKEMPLEAREDSSPPGWFLRRKLVRALSLFERVIQLNPANWSALWLMGKVHLRLQNSDAALSCFERAHQANPAQPEIAREASRCAMDLGLHEAAVDFAQRAIQMDPNSCALRANLSLACLIAGLLPDAQLAANQAVMGDPTERYYQTLKAMARHFGANGSTPPPTPAALFEYWRKNGER
jgi:tetratricopeptide (TPR) repeat protein